MIEFLKELFNQLPGPEILEACIVMLSVTFLILTNQFFPHKWLDRLVANKTGLSEQECSVYVERGCDFVFMGLIPALLIWLLPGINLKSFGMVLPTGRWGWWVFGGSFATLIPVVFRYFFCKPTPMYPEVHEKDWDIVRFFRYNFSWVFSLAGYELIYRGILYLALYRAFGFLPAVIIQTCFYGFAHYKRGAFEAFNCTYFSAYQCIVVFYTGSILSGYLTHMAIVIMNTFFEVLKNPEMQFVSRKPKKTV